MRALSSLPRIDDWPELDDGFGGHAPVDHDAPKPFGLNTVHGKVWERCLDGNDLRFCSEPQERIPFATPWGPWRARPAAEGLTVFTFRAQPND